MSAQKERKIENGDTVCRERKKSEETIFVRYASSASSQSGASRFPQHRNFCVRMQDRWVRIRERDDMSKNKVKCKNVNAWMETENMIEKVVTTTIQVHERVGIQAVGEPFSLRSCV